MRPLPRRLPVLSASALAAVLFTTGCSEIQEVSQGIDKAQQCVQAAGIVTEMAAKVGSLVNDPAEMEKALNDGAAKLGTLADEAANTTLKEAADGVAKDLEGLNATSANEAVDAAQKVATDSVQWTQQLAGACG
ncbi:hypothetical protein [Streptosporangium lutulentum]|uniref:Uncharacterized protein n=1 Tax=Streptosporangium lutulentum TaxID=1461250 RepID=A0ABT9Q3U5_9ACTN|nr:hypothetical protein [Streptosporangium lutulentum]MDP9841357.1 hypothetical protein [Streptosporangium lutulentum]